MKQQLTAVNDLVLKQNASDLSTAMTILAKNCFVKCIKSHYEEKFPLPVVRLTSLKIKKSKTVNKNNLSVGDEELDTPQSPRSQSTYLSKKKEVKESYLSDELQLVYICYYVITSFMQDQSEQLNKGQSTHLFETIIKERRKNVLGKTRLFNKSTSSKETDSRTPSPLQKRGRNRPNSTYVNVDSGYDSDQTNLYKNLYSFITADIEKMSVQEKIIVISTVGMNYTYLRDEIYCQILKQIHGNPSLRSAALGWILLSLVSACFPPSNTILPYIECVLHEHNSGGSNYCLKILMNVIKKGVRKNPPCSLELQAAKHRNEIRLPIICMDQSVRTVWADPHTTVQQICTKIASKNRLDDKFGFAIFFSLDNKVVQLGGGSFYIMDAISQAEQFATNNNLKLCWRIYFRREFFSPLEANGLNNNHMKTWLTYKQICGGVQSGEYECRKPQDLALLLAHQCLINYKEIHYDIDSVKCTEMCKQALPREIPISDVEKWTKMVMCTLSALKDKKKNDFNYLEIMQQIIRYSARSFILSFTKTFLLDWYTDGENTHSSKTKLMINHTKLTIQSQSKSQSSKVLVNVTVPLVEIRSVEKIKEEEMMVRIVTFTDAQHTMKCCQWEEIIYILKRFIDEIKSEKINAF